MIPPLTLPDSRQEAFAYHIASGLSPSSAYTAAGFSPNNAKARAQELIQDPDITDRIGHLKFSLPKSDELKDRFAPSLLLMPQTQEEMLAWLWQVMNGSRKILPIQMRAAALFARMNGWHLAKPPPPEETPKPKPKPVPLIDEERQAIAVLNDLTLKNDIANQTFIEEDLINYHSQMADLAFIANVAHPQDRRVQPPSPAIHVPEDPEPEAPESQPPSQPPATPAPQAQRASVSSPGFEEPWGTPTLDTPPRPTPTELRPSDPVTTPLPLSPSESPSQPLDPQPPTSPNPQMGKNLKIPQSPPDPREASPNAVAKNPGPSGFGDTTPVRPLALSHNRRPRPPQNKRPPLPLKTY